MIQIIKTVRSNSFLAARAVVEGGMTLGMMMSLSYIVGQLSAPIEQFITLVRSFQDAKISLEQLGEIHGQADEDATALGEEDNPIVVIAKLK